MLRIAWWMFSFPLSTFPTQNGIAIFLFFEIIFQFPVTFVIFLPLIYTLTIICTVFNKLMQSSLFSAGVSTGSYVFWQFTISISIMVYEMKLGKMSGFWYFMIAKLGLVSKKLEMFGLFASDVPFHDLGTSIADSLNSL